MIARCSANRPSSAAANAGILVRSRPPGQLGQLLGVTLTRDQGPQHRPTRHTQQVGDNRIEFDPSIFEDLGDALPLAGVGLDQAFAVTGQIAQLADHSRWHEAAPQQAVLEQLSQPGRVSHVFSELN